MARGYLRWSAKELGEKAGVAESTVKRMEHDDGFPIARGANIEAVYKTLTEPGSYFLGRTVMVLAFAFVRSAPCPLSSLSLCKNDPAPRRSVEGKLQPRSTQASRRRRTAGTK